jgi:hypothetical protein
MVAVELVSNGKEMVMAYTYSPKKDWRILYGAARATARDYWHVDVVAAYAIGIAADAGCRAGFALRHAARAAELALLDRGGRVIRGAFARRYWRAKAQARHSAAHLALELPMAA